MPFYILSLMFYFNTFSTAMFYYLILHGSYGCLWVLKDQVFPDNHFQRKVTLPSVMVAYVVMGLYCVPAYRLASNKDLQNISFERFFCCLVIYLFGVVTMLLADSQKHYTLKYKKGLIADGMFKYTRNPNYLGEMMIYGSFVLLINDCCSYACVLWVWPTIFAALIYRKEISFRLKDGYEEYAERSLFVIPKINGRFLDSIVFYGISGYICWWFYTHGGIVEGLKFFRSAFFS